MRKWQLFSIVSLSLIGLSSPALANDENIILPTNDNAGCTRLIQKGDAVPPEPVGDLNAIKICMDNCDGLYQSLNDQGLFDKMVRGINYCKKSLNNLYFASVAQTITQELNQQTQQQHASDQQELLNRMAALLKQHQQNQPNQNNAYGNNTDETSNNPTNTSSTPAPPPQVIGPPDNVNW